jgi:hypothetical protein
MLKVANKIVLSVIMLNIVMLSVVAPPPPRQGCLKVNHYSKEVLQNGTAQYD